MRRIMLNNREYRDCARRCADRVAARLGELSLAAGVPAAILETCGS